MLDALTSTSQELLVGGLWVIQWQNLDFNGALVDLEQVITVTSPSGAVITPTATRTALGTYRVAITVAAQGLHTAVVQSAGSGAIAFGAYVRAITSVATRPTVQDVRDYSNGEISEDVWPEAEVQSALDAEYEDQTRRCGVRAIYPAMLAEMLKRRVLINLKMRKILTPAQAANEFDTGGNYLPFNDPIVRKNEAPYRTVRLGR